jgi:hypothetical protein
VVAATGLEPVLPKIRKQILSPLDLPLPQVLMRTTPFGSNANKCR